MKNNTSVSTKRFFTLSNGGVPGQINCGKNSIWKVNQVQTNKDLIKWFLGK